MTGSPRDAAPAPEHTHRRPRAGQGVDSVDDVDDHRPPGPLPATGPGGSRRADRDRRHPDCWRAKDRILNRDVAVRVHTPAGPAAHAWITRALTAGGLATPALAMVYDASEGSVATRQAPPAAPPTSSTSGSTARRWPSGSAEGPLPEREVRTVLRRLADGVAEAHRVGLAVGGLTPENVVLRPNGLVGLRGVPAATGTIDGDVAALGALLEACLTGLRPERAEPRPLPAPPTWWRWPAAPGRPSPARPCPAWPPWRRCWPSARAAGPADDGSPPGPSDDRRRLAAPAPRPPARRSRSRDTPTRGAAGAELRCGSTRTRCRRSRGPPGHRHRRPGAARAATRSTPAGRRPAGAYAGPRAPGPAATRLPTGRVVRRARRRRHRPTATRHRRRPTRRRGRRRAAPAAGHRPAPARAARGGRRWPGGSAPACCRSPAPSTTRAPPRRQQRPRRARPATGTPRAGRCGRRRSPGAEIFDPEGDGEPENDGDVPLTFDGDAATTWST